MRSYWFCGSGSCIGSEASREVVRREALKPVEEERDEAYRVLRLCARAVIDDDPNGEAPLPPGHETIADFVRVAFKVKLEENARLRSELENEREAMYQAQLGESRAEQQLAQARGLLEEGLGPAEFSAEEFIKSLDRQDEDPWAIKVRAFLATPLPSAPLPVLPLGHEYVPCNPASISDYCGNLGCHHMPGPCRQPAAAHSAAPPEPGQEPPKA